MAAKRILYLDGLRGVAILSVVLFHAYVAYPEHLPFGDRFGVLPVRLGWQGVELFFLISGFVILMTLERCSGFANFVARRWLRLFPAMLIVSLLILLFSAEFGGPNAPRTWLDLLPGLTFVNPSLINSLTGMHLQSMEGAYWSLYVEVVFYAIFGLVYFAVSEYAGIAAIFVLWLLTVSANALFGPALDNIPGRIAAAATWMGFVHFGWFASGSLFYLYSKTEKSKFLAPAVVVGIASIFSLKYQLVERLGLLTVVAIFFAAVVSRTAQVALSHRIIVFFGFVSYPLYLVHYSISIYLLTVLAKYAPWLPALLLPVLPLAFVVCLAWLIAKFGEPAFRELLRWNYSARAGVTMPPTGHQPGYRKTYSERCGQSPRS